MRRSGPASPAGQLVAAYASYALDSRIITAGRDLTRTKLRTALSGVQKFDLGGFSVDYAAAAPFVGSHHVDLGVLGAGGRFLG